MPKHYVRMSEALEGIRLGDKLTTLLKMYALDQRASMLVRIIKEIARRREVRRIHGHRP
jgi:hypothetical protein